MFLVRNLFMALLLLVIEVVSSNHAMLYALTLAPPTISQGGGGDTFGKLSMALNQVLLL